MNYSGKYTSVEIPDIFYVFSPSIISISGANEGIKINSVNYVVKSYEDDTSYEDTLTYNGEEEIRRDIGYFLRQFFNIERLNILDVMFEGRAETIKYLTFNLYIKTNMGEDSIEDSLLDIPVVFGSVKPFKTYYGSETIKIKKFKEYPFSLTFLLKKSQTVKSKVDVGITVTTVIYTNKSQYTQLANVVPKGTFLNVSKYKIVAENSACVDTSTSWPFIDLTDAENFTYNVEQSNKNTGVYLAWLNMMGGINYYLFDKINETLQVSEEEYKKKEYYRFPVSDDIPQRNKSAKRVLTLGVPLAEKQEYSYIEDVVLSPMVYMLTESKDAMIRVNVVTGDFERTGAELQDFTFQIELPEEYTVKL